MKPVLCCLIGLFALISCTAPKTIANKPENITRYKNSSFAWSAINNAENKEKGSLFFSAADSLIRAEVNNQLQQKSLHMVGSKERLLVSYCVLENKKLEPIKMSYTQRYGYNAPYAAQYPDSAKNWLFLINSTTLLIDLHDAKTNQLVWRGWNIYTEDNTLTDKPALIKNAVEAIFRQFPVLP